MKLLLKDSYDYRKLAKILIVHKPATEYCCKITFCSSYSKIAANGYSSVQTLLKIESAIPNEACCVDINNFL